jgi:alpha-galactosidase
MAFSKAHLICFALGAMSFVSLEGATAQKNELAERPPMGWNSWNHFRDKVDDASVRAQAEAMVSSGMRDAGYTYVNIDDTWEGERDANGNIQANKKFPNMKALADFVHSKGLKIGIYSSPGAKTCASMKAAWGTKFRMREHTPRGESIT